MANPHFPVLFARILVLLAIAFGWSLATPLQAEEPTVDSVFADAPFDKWAAQGPREEVPWKVHMSADRLSFHQRLIATIQVEVPGPELLKRSHDEHITLLIEVRNGQGVSSRNYGLLELDNLKPEMKRSDVEFSWQAFAVPGQYEVSVALWDKKSGEHNFLRRLFHVDAYKNDPLPEMWRGLDVFEFWSTKRDGPDYMFHSDIEGRPSLTRATRRPIHMEVLLDLTPSAEIFRGNYGHYNHYLGAALPTFKLFNQITLSNGSRSAAAVDVVQRHVVFEQNDGKDLDWATLRKALSPDNGPGVVSVKDLQNKQQSPVYLREEIVRRLNAGSDQAAKPGKKPLQVFVLIGSPTHSYTFPKLPEIETGKENDCVIYYLQFEFNQQQGITGGAGNVEKMLRPLKMRTFEVRSPDDVRRALAKVMEEVGRME
ncbi:MAG TPA: hypothetical protein VNZ47_00280 [Candidatus Dormibacteraeota bacterium]|nr:hypothetical protein [Candidatus Dormibacteraeota bacterium]